MRDQNGNSEALSPHYLLSASEAAKKLRSGELNVETYARSILSKIDARGAKVGAWAYLDRERVLQEARRLDSLPPSARGPLHGVAVAVKDVIQTKDMPTQHNSLSYAVSSGLTFQSEVGTDANSIAMLRQAGALIVGKTTTTEFAATVTGPKGTKNPHDLKRTPGGSSSGSGAVVADFQAAIALGTQTGGSTIRPGSYNGILAWKPTWGVVSREGCKEYSPILDTVGWYAREVEDLELVGDVLGIVDDDDEEDENEIQLNPHPLSARDNDLSGFRFALCKTHVWDEQDVSIDVEKAMKRASEILRARGARVEEMNLPPEFSHATSWHRTIMLADGRAAFRSEWLVNRHNLAESLIAQVENRAGELMMGMAGKNTMDGVEAKEEGVMQDGKIRRKKLLEAFDGIGALRPKADAILRQYHALITPSVPSVAPEGHESTGNASFCCMWTVSNIQIRISSTLKLIGVGSFFSDFHDITGPSYACCQRSWV